MRVFHAHLHTTGRVIGVRDLTAADSKPWAVEWRGALNDRIQQEFTRFIAS